MKNTELTENALWIANELKAYFEKSPNDLHSESEWDKYKQSIVFEANSIDIIVKPVFDSRRSSDPLLFDSKTRWCFCQASTSLQDRKLSTSSLLIPKGKGILYALECGPEPKEEHFIDMCQVARSFVGIETVLVINLPGSGASLPQHFHIQIWPKGKSWDIWLTNFKPIEHRLMVSNSIEIREFMLPMWGLEIKFPEAISAFQMGKVLYKTTQQLRLHSQLKLTYNLYIDSKEPNVVKIIFRESWKECPFDTAEVHAIISQITNELTATRIANSDNAKWRWGWSECVGGLPARDNSFVDSERFGTDFWKKIFQFMTLDYKYQKPVWSRVIDTFEKFLE